MNNLRHSLLLQIHRQIRILRSLVRIVDSRESLDLSSSSLGEQSLSVGLLTVGQRSSDVDEEEVSSVGSSGLLDDRSSGFSRVGVGSGRGSDDGGSGSGELGLVEGREEEGREREGRESAEEKRKGRVGRKGRRRKTHGNESDSLDVLVSILSRESKFYREGRKPGCQYGGETGEKNNEKIATHRTKAQP